jgi:protein-S-isoprenylcysteine O-methyltransferase Ste14
MNLFFCFFGFIILLILVFVNYLIDIKIKQLDSSFKYYYKEYSKRVKELKENN